MQEKDKKEETVHTYDNGFHPKEVILKENYNFYPQGFFYRFFHKVAVFLTQFIFLFIKFFIWNYRVKGRKNLKKQKGFVLVSNHTHQLDALMILTTLYYKDLYVTTLQSNMGFGIISKYFRLGGAVPIPNDIKLFRKFSKETVNTLQKGKSIIIYPEATLVPYSDHIRPFMVGAFHFAIQANATIIPSVMTYHKPKGFYKLTRRKKPCIHYNILPPYTVKDMGNKKLTLDTATSEIHQIMSDYFDEHSDYFK